MNRLVGVAALALGAINGSVQAQSARLSQADSLATWYALGINAHHVCAGMWVVGKGTPRTPDAIVAEDIARFPAFRWEQDFRVEIDSVNHVATVTDPQVGRRSAKHSADQGCAILPAGAKDVFFQPTAVRPALPDPATQDWPTGDRNATGTFSDVNAAAITATLDWAFNDAGLQRAQNTRGVVIVYKGKIIGERYASGWGPYTPQISWSMGKSIAATLIGVLVQKGDLKLDAPAPVPEWQGTRDPRRSITIANLLNMSSGLDFDNFGLTPNTSYTAANEHFRIYFDAIQVFAHSVNQPLRFTPGSVQRYRNSDPLTLMYIARRIVENKGQPFLQFPQRDLFDQIGARGFVLETDAWGNFIITGFDYGGSRDWARLGLLYLQNGVWQGKRILPANWSQFVATPAPGDPSRGYGGLWWLNRGGSLRRVPEDAYWAAGYMGQYTMVIPSRDLVIVRQGPSPGGDAPYMDELVARILEAIGRPK
jgi:CubicO group peptidase (beta-lactamase class C family)